MNILLTTTEIADLRNCYAQRLQQQRTVTTTVEEEKIIADILNLFPAYPSDPDELHSLPLTPELWRTLREAVKEEIPLWELLNAHVIATFRRRLLHKLDELALIAYVEEADTTAN